MAILLPLLPCSQAQNSKEYSYLIKAKKKTKRISKLTVTVKDTIHLKESHKTKSFEENQYSILRNRQGKFDCLKSTVQA